MEDSAALFFRFFGFFLLGFLLDSARLWKDFCWILLDSARILLDYARILLGFCCFLLDFLLNSAWMILKFLLNFRLHFPTWSSSSSSFFFFFFFFFFFYSLLFSVSHSLPCSQEIFRAVLSLSLSLCSLPRFILTSSSFLHYSAVTFCCFLVPNLISACCPKRNICFWDLISFFFLSFSSLSARTRCWEARPRRIQEARCNTWARTQEG